MAAEAPPQWSPDVINLVTDHCNGNENATKTIKDYCATNCSDGDWQVIDNFCADLAEEQQASNPNQPATPDPATPDNNGSGTFVDDLPADSQQLVAKYCRGDSSAENTLKNYCSSSGCTEAVLDGFSGYCSHLGINRDMTSLQIASGREPQSDEPIVSDQSDEPIVSDEPTPPSSSGSGTFVDDLSDEQQQLVADYCRGDSSAENTLVNYCSSSGCSDAVLDGFSGYCSHLGEDRDMTSLEVASGRVEPQSDDSIVSGQDTPNDNCRNGNTGNCKGTLVISWSSPTQRENGDSLSASDLDGYEIYLTADQSDESTTIVIDDPSTTEHTIKKLPDDTYHVALVAKDDDGLLSDLSEVVSATITVNNG
jgi:hypothetical protein